MRTKKNGCVFALAALGTCAACGAMYDVREYGAVGDGMTIDTPAIQRAVDEASKAGGGTVAIGSGRYVVANLTLKDNVTLRLAKGAVLLGATNEVDYVDGIMSVVSAFKARNIAIEGEGTIDGRGWAAPLKHPRRWRDVHFRNCGNVRVEDVTLKDPALWTFFLQECEDCIVRGVRIFAHANFNNDGIDIEAKRVLVENCVIDSDDDAICPKSYNPDFVCEGVEVRNCVLASNCNFIKFGTTSHGTFRNCYIHHCKLRPCAVSRLRFWDECSWPGREAGITDKITGLAAVALEVVDGGGMENVRVSDISFNDGGVQTPVLVRLGRRCSRDGVESYLRNCVIENMEGKTASFIASSITGIPGLRPSGITLRNFQLCLKTGASAEAAAKKPDEREKKYPENRMFDCVLPAYGFYVRHADGVKFENIRIRTYGSADPRPPLVTDDCTGFSVSKDCIFGDVSALGR